MAAVTVWTQAATNYLAALNAAGSPATIWRTRFEPIGADEAQAGALNLFSTKISVKYTGANDSASVAAHFTVRGTMSATDEVDLAYDPLVLWAWQQLRKDPSLGGTVSDARVEDVEIGYVDKNTSDEICVDVTICVEVEVDRDNPAINRTYL
jgi:hypothetical protein